MDEQMVSFYTSKLEDFHRADREREELVADLLAKYNNLLISYQKKCDDYENEVESRRMWRQKEHEARKEVMESRHVIVSRFLVPRAPA
jgi:hypothetical protein